VARAEAVRRVLVQAPALTQPFGVGADDAELVAAAYLWGIGVRYATDDQDAAGAAVGRLVEWLLPALEAWAGQTDGSQPVPQPDVEQPALTVEGAVRVEGH